MMVSALARFIYKWMIFVAALPHVATFNKFLLLTLVHTTLLTLVSREEGTLTVLTWLHPALILDGGCVQRGLRRRVPHLFRRECFLVCFPFVDLQSVFRLERVITMVTLEKCGGS